MLLFASSIIDLTTFIVVLALIENEGGAVTTNEILSESSCINAWPNNEAKSSQESPTPGNACLSISDALEVPFS